ncbi:sigma factor [Achromobacter sp. AGC39]
MELLNASSPDATCETPRAFRTDLACHEPLLHKFARMAWYRLLSAGCAEEYEDVFADMRFDYLAAARKYDPDRGVSFTAYMGRAVWNEFNKRAEKQIAIRNTIGLHSLSEVDIRNGDDDGDFSLLDTLHGEDLVPSAEERLEQNQAMAQKIAMLPPQVRAVLRELVNPSAGVRATYAAMLAQREVAKRQGTRVPRVPTEINLKVVFKHFGMDAKDIRAFNSACLEHLGVDL